MMISIDNGENMSEKKYLVTGGAGFIGSNLVKELSKNADVTVIDDLSTGKLENIQELIDEKKINFIKGSITDVDFLQKEFRNIDYVFHLAAIVSIPKSIIDPVTTHSVNVNGLFNVLIAARDNNVKKVVYSSSCAVYGNPLICPIKENSIKNPLSPYASSKLIGEYYCKIFSEVYKLPTSSLRYFNVYGPNQDPTSEYAAVVPKFIENILENKPIIIYSNGEQTRDFIYVKDVVKANILASKNKEIDVYNVGSGNKTTINELAKIIMKIKGKNIEIKYKDNRPGDILHSYAEMSKIKKLNYKAEYDLKKGLRKTFDWFTKSSSLN